MQEKLPSNLIDNNDNDYCLDDKQNEQLSNIEAFNLHIQFIDGNIPLLKRHIRSLQHFSLLPAMSAHIRSSLEQIIVADLIKGKSGIITVSYNESHQIKLDINDAKTINTISFDKAIKQSANTIWAYNNKQNIVYYYGEIYKAVDTLTIDLLKTLSYELKLLDSKVEFEFIYETCSEAFLTSNSQYIIEIEGKSGDLVEKLKSSFAKL